MKNNIETTKSCVFTTAKNKNKLKLFSFHNLIIFLIGFFGYGFIEICFRGYTHWSMLLTGGACLLSMYFLNEEYNSTPILIKALAGAVIITVFEFAVGIIVNIIFKLNVWNYSALPFDLFGQICPLFFILWFFLCLLLLGICKLLMHFRR